MIDVRVFGPGCKRCATTAEMVEAAADTLELSVSVEKVTDYAAIAQAGVVSTPGITINGKLVHSGGLPDAANLEDWLRQA